MMDVAEEAADTILFKQQGKVIQNFQNNHNIDETTMKLMNLHRQ